MTRPRRSCQVLGCHAAAARGFALLAFTVLACSEKVADPGPISPCVELTLEAPRSDSNLVLIVNDTMRRDRIGAYGGPARTTALDEFAADHLLFERAAAESNWTRPSMATLFTSLYPTQHGVGDAQMVGFGSTLQQMVEGSKLDVLSAEFETLPEVLQRAGLRTAGFVSNPWLAAEFGFGQGFDHYDDSYVGFGYQAEPLTARAIDWLESLESGERFFLYLHYMESHRPYGRLDLDEVNRARERIEADRRPIPTQAKLLLLNTIKFSDGRSLLATDVRPSLTLIEMAYDRGVEQFDLAFGRLLERLSGDEAFDRTAVIVTSDHGEALFTRGYGDHGKGLFDDETALPLIARLPGIEPERGRVACPVGLIDLLPSLCAYLGIECPKSAQGVSLLGGKGETARYLVTEAAAGEFGHRAIRNASYKLMFEPRGPPVPSGERRFSDEQPYSLYDLVADPEEQHDLAASREVTAETYRVLEVMVPALHAAVPPFDTPRSRFEPLSDELRDRLRELGYGE